MFRVGMPHSARGRRGSSAQARIARPEQGGAEEQGQSAATISADTPSTQRTCGEMRAPSDGDGGDLVAGEVGQGRGPSRPRCAARPRG